MVHDRVELERHDAIQTVVYEIRQRHRHAIRLRGGIFRPNLIKHTRIDGFKGLVAQVNRDQGVDDAHEAVAKVGGFGTEKHISQKQESCGPHEKPFLDVLGIRRGLELLRGEHSFVASSG